MSYYIKADAEYYYFIRERLYNEFKEVFGNDTITAYGPQIYDAIKFWYDKMPNVEDPRQCHPKTLSLYLVCSECINNIKDFLVINKVYKKFTNIFDAKHIFEHAEYLEKIKLEK